MVKRINGPADVGDIRNAVNALIDAFNAFEMRCEPLLWKEGVPAPASVGTEDGLWKAGTPAPVNQGV